MREQKEQTADAENIKATVEFADDDFILFSYQHKRATFNITIPRTEQNKHLKKYDRVTLALFILKEERHG
jgi:predicted transcriptional regulator